MPGPFNNIVTPEGRKRVNRVPPPPFVGPVLREVRWGRKLVKLSPLEARLHHALKSRPSAFSTRELIDYVWANRRAPKTDNALHVLIHSLRQKMPEAVANHAPGFFKYVRHDPWSEVRRP